MNVEERKQIFTVLLGQLLSKYGGTKNKLAESLQIHPSTLTPWLQGKIDPAALDIITFDRLAQVKGCSIDELAIFFKLKPVKTDQPINKLRKMVGEMLEGLSQEQLSQKLGISKNTVKNWLNSSKKIDPRQIPAGTIINLAQERDWSIERLLLHLGLKTDDEIEENILADIQNLSIQLSLTNKIKFQSWFYSQLEEDFKNSSTLITNQNIDTFISDRTVCIILETENLEIASNYASNLAIHLNLKPENIKVTTVSKLPESIADIDILIFDISTPESASIALIEDIEFDRDIVVFIDADLPSKVRSSLEDKVTDVVVKPIDWQKLKDKAYFS